MRGGALPPALLCAAVGLALAFAPRSALLRALIGLVVCAVAASLAPTPQPAQDAIFLGLWISIAVTAASVHLPKGLPPPAALALALNAGLWSGLVVASAGGRWSLAEALPWSLLCLPAAAMASRGWGVAVKVPASWLIAVAMLAGGLSFVPTPGYKPDHMD